MILDVIDYGLSIDGGYYAVCYVKGEGKKTFRANTLIDLCIDLGITEKDLEKAQKINHNF